MTLKNIIMSIPRRAAVALSLAVVVFAPLSVVASTSAASKPCGSRCNGQPPSYNQCDYSATQVNPYPTNIHPNTFQTNDYPKTFLDPYITVAVYYSGTCHTMWMDVSVTKTIGRSYCTLILDRYVHGDVVNPYVFTHACPATGTTYETPMVNDDSPSNQEAAFAEVFEVRKADNAASRFLFYW